MYSESRDRSDRVKMIFDSTYSFLYCSFGMQFSVLVTFPSRFEPALVLLHFLYPAAILYCLFPNLMHVSQLINPLPPFCLGRYNLAKSRLRWKTPCQEPTNYLLLHLKYPSLSCIHLLFDGRQASTRSEFELLLLSCRFRCVLLFVVLAMLSLLCCFYLSFSLFVHVI